MGAMIADCRQCEQRQPSAPANLGSFGARAKFGSAGNCCKKFVGGGSVFVRTCRGPCPPYRQHTDHPGPDDQLADDQHTDDQHATQAPQ